jgi:hypothetical protein
MHDSFVVRGRESLRDTQSILDSAPHGQGTGFKPFPQILSLKEFTDQKWCTLVRANVVDSKDIRMV